MRVLHNLEIESSGEALWKRRQLIAEMPLLKLFMQTCSIGLWTASTSRYILGNGVVAELSAFLISMVLSHSKLDFLHQRSIH